MENVAVGSEGSEHVEYPQAYRHEAYVNTQLHVFSDASKEAFSTTVYARSELSNGDVVVRLVAAKSRVFPLRSVSFPRLELCGSTIGTRLGKRVREIFQSGRSKKLPITSMNVLY